MRSSKHHIIAEWLAVAADYVREVDSESACDWRNCAETLSGTSEIAVPPAIVVAHAGGEDAYLARLRPVTHDAVAAG